MTPQQVADLYYDAFRNRTDFSEVPMAEGLAFRSPMMSLEGAQAFRGALAGLVARFQALDIRHQLADAESVVTVYDFDLGLPTGPIAMSEIVQVKGDEITAVELIFDPKPLLG